MIWKKLMIKDFHLMQECAGVERVERDDIIIYSVQQKQSDNMLFLQHLNRIQSVVPPAPEQNRVVCVRHLWSAQWTPAPAWWLCRRFSCPAPPSGACSSPCRNKQCFRFRISGSWKIIWFSLLTLTWCSPQIWVWWRRRWDEAEPAGVSWWRSPTRPGYSVYPERQNNDIITAALTSKLTRNY